MSSDYELGVQLRRQIELGISRGFQPNLRNVEAMIKDLVSKDQEILISAVKHVATAPGLLGVIKDGNLAFAELALLGVVRELKEIYAPSVCIRVEDVARGLLNLSAFHGAQSANRESTARSGYEVDSRISSDDYFTVQDISRRPLTQSVQAASPNRPSPVVLMVGSIVGLIVMAVSGFLIGLTTQQKHAGRARVSPPPAAAPQTATQTSGPAAANLNAPPSLKDTGGVEIAVPSRTSAPVSAQDSVGHEIDDIADEIFWRKYPQMQGRKLTTADGALAREWSAIRQCDAIVDHAFYQLYPSMRGQAIDPANLEMVSAWNKIRSSVSGCQ